MKVLQIDKSVDANLKPVKDSDGTMTALEISTEDVRVKNLEVLGNISSIEAGTITGGLTIGSGNKIYLDGGSDTYISEGDDDELHIYVGVERMVQFDVSPTTGNMSWFRSSSIGFTRVEATYGATNTHIDFKSTNKCRLEMTGDITNVNLNFPQMSGNFLLVCTTDGDHDVTNWKAFEADGSAATHANVLWAGGSVPAFTNNGIDIVSFYWDYDEQQCYGTASLAFAAP